MELDVFKKEMSGRTCYWRYIPAQMTRYLSG